MFGQLAFPGGENLRSDSVALGRFHDQSERSYTEESMECIRVSFI